MKLFSQKVRHRGIAFPNEGLRAERGGMCRGRWEGLMETVFSAAVLIVTTLVMAGLTFVGFLKNPEDETSHSSNK